MKHHAELLILFVKHPVAGQTKTRLAASIGHPKALAAYQEMLQHLRSVARETQRAVAVFYGNQIPDHDLWQEAGWPRLLQSGATLGDRMNGAFAWGQAQGYQRMVLVGSDIPGVDAPLLEQAFAQLQTHGAVLGPANDGGYYLIGLHGPDAQIFDDLPWSTPEVLRLTQQRLTEAGLSYAWLPEQQDVDTVEDLPGTFLAHYLSADSSAS